MRLTLRAASIATLLVCGGLALAQSEPGSAQEGAPATRPAVAPVAKWIGFQKVGIEQVPCVLVNEQGAHAQLAMLPDGTTKWIVRGDVAKGPDDYRLQSLLGDGAALGRSATPEQRKQLGIPDLTDAQWKELAKIPWASSLWAQVDENSDAAHAAIDEMRKWAQLPSGPQRAARETKVMDAVKRAADGPQTESAKRFFDAIDRVRNVLTKEQFQQLTAQTGAQPSLHLDSRSRYSKGADGVFGGLILLANEQVGPGAVQVEFAYGAGIDLASFLPTEPHFRSEHSSRTLSQRPDFLDSHAVCIITLCVPRPRDSQAERDPHGNYIGSVLLRELEALQHRNVDLKLSDFGVTPEQQATMEKLHKKLDQLGTLSLALSDAEANQIQQCLIDWANSKPDRPSAEKALLHEMQTVGQPKIGKYLEYQALWKQMGDVLTGDQLSAIYGRLNSLRQGTPSSNDPNSPSPNPGL